MRTPHIGLGAVVIATIIATAACSSTPPPDINTTRANACDTLATTQPVNSTERTMEKVVTDSAAAMSAVLNAPLKRSMGGNNVGTDTWSGTYCDSDMHIGLTIVAYHNVTKKDWANMTVGPRCLPVKPAHGYPNTLTATCTISKLQVNSMARVDLNESENYVLSLSFDPRFDPTRTVRGIAVAAQQIQQFKQS